MSGAACVVLAALAIVVWPAAFKQSRVFAAAPAIEEFADWRGAILAANTVLVAPAQDVGGFVWFTLGRPNYLALDQSAGVVFSRETALEVRRRSEVLLPLMDPNWEILTTTKPPLGGAQGRSDNASADGGEPGQVCADPKLGFVASPCASGFRRCAMTMRDHGRIGISTIAERFDRPPVPSVRSWWRKPCDISPCPRSHSAWTSCFCSSSSTTAPGGISPQQPFPSSRDWWSLTALSIALVFKYRRLDTPHLEFAAFAAIGVVGVAINAGAMAAGVNYLGLHFLVAKCGAAGVTFAWNFLARRQMLFVRPLGLNDTSA